MWMGISLGRFINFLELNRWDVGTEISIKLVSGVNGDGYRIRLPKYEGRRGNTDHRPRGVEGGDVIDAFDIDDFDITLDYGNGSDGVSEADFDDDGNRIGVIAGSPKLSKPKRKLTTTWASLKRRS